VISRAICGGICANKFANEVSGLFPAVAGCSERVVNQNISVAAEVCKVAWKRTSDLTIM